MKTFVLHIDALMVLILVFLITLGFNFFQRFQYHDLLQKHITLQVNALKMDFNLSYMKVDLKKCNEYMAELTN
jgi:uncharacterized protein YneF (UPF0154 family)